MIVKLADFLSKYVNFENPALEEKIYSVFIDQSVLLMIGGPFKEDIFKFFVWMADAKVYSFSTNLDLIFYCSFGDLGINQIFFPETFEKEKEKI